MAEDIKPLDIKGRLIHQIVYRCADCPEAITCRKYREASILGLDPDFLSDKCYYPEWSHAMKAELYTILDQWVAYSKISVGKMRRNGYPEDADKLGAKAEEVDKRIRTFLDQMD